MFKDFQVSSIKYQIISVKIAVLNYQVKLLLLLKTI